MVSVRFDKRRRDDGIAERQANEHVSPWWEVHIARYLFASTHVVGRRALDIACGTGYGLSFFVRAGARYVVGADLDRQVAREAQVELGDGSGQVIVADGCRLPFADRSFDVLTSFETLEHLEQRDKFLSELQRVLTPEGICLLSTPNANHTLPVNGKPRNPYHVHEYTPSELQAELGRHFNHVKMLGQILDPRFVIPPFWDDQEKLSKDPRMHVKVLVWRALRRLPFRARDQMSRALWGQPFFPSESDYRFTESGWETAPVLVALCQNVSTS